MFGKKSAIGLMLQQILDTVYRPSIPGQRDNNITEDHKIGFSQYIVQKISNRVIFSPSFDPSQVSRSENKLWDEHTVTIGNQKLTFHINKGFKKEKDTIIFFPSMASYQYFKWPQQLFEGYNVALLHYHVELLDGTIPEYDIFDKVHANTERMLPHVINSLKTKYEVKQTQSINSRIIIMGYCYGSMLALKHVIRNKDQEPYKYVLAIGSPINYRNILKVKQILTSYLVVISRIINVHSLCYLLPVYIFNNRSDMQEIIGEHARKYMPYFLIPNAIAVIAFQYLLWESRKVGNNQEDFKKINPTEQIYFLNGPGPTGKENNNILQRAIDLFQGNINDALSGLRTNYDAVIQIQLEKLCSGKENMRVIMSNDYEQALTAEENKTLKDDPHYGFFSQKDSTMIYKILQEIIEPDLQKKASTQVEEITCAATVEEKLVA